VQVSTRTQVDVPQLDPAEGHSRVALPSGRHGTHQCVGIEQQWRQLGEILHHHRPYRTAAISTIATSNTRAPGMIMRR
jgi:hypothetical protein